MATTCTTRQITTRLHSQRGPRHMVLSSALLAELDEMSAGAAVRLLRRLGLPLSVVDRMGPVDIMAAASAED